MATVTSVVHQEWDLTERIVVGELTMADVTSAMGSFNQGQITRRVLWNFSDATFDAISSIDIERLSIAAVPLAKARTGGKTAVVAPTDLGYGFSRMYQAYREINMVTLPYKSFRVRQAAIDWLLSDDV